MGNVWSALIVFIIAMTLTDIMSAIVSLKEQKLTNDKQDLMRKNELEKMKFDAIEVQIGKVMEKIQEWKANPPTNIQNGKYPYNYEVELEIKTTEKGAKYAILHVEGRPSKKYRLN